MSLNEHFFDDDGVHDEDDCDVCIERTCSVSSSCRCGNCCERLILESSLRDAEREPRIANECSPLRGIDDEPVGHLLNDRSNDMACHFFDREHRLCTIYETRPLMCRVFNCDVERCSGELVELLNYQPDSAKTPPVDE